LLELNQAVLIRGGIIFLQYFFVVLIYFFIYRIGKLLYLDLRRMQASGPNVSPGQYVEGKHYVTVLEADEASGLMVGDCFPLKTTTTIGRNLEQNTIVIQDTFVSAEHALIQRYKDCYWISDLSSTNGTFVNGNRIEDEMALTPGDMIKIGSVVLHFEG